MLRFAAENLITEQPDKEPGEQTLDPLSWRPGLGVFMGEEYKVVKGVGEGD